MGVGGQRVGNAFGDFDPFGLKRRHFGRIVGHQPDRSDAEQLQHPRRDGEVARLHRQTQPFVGLVRIEALVPQVRCGRAG